jgi:hypothetical protein
VNLRDQLNDYSRRFAEQLFAAYPEWEARATTNPWPDADRGCFVVEVYSLTHPDRALWVGTDGGEITVGFGAYGWHDHYGDWTGADEASSFAEALADIAAIVTEQKILATGFRNGRELASTLLAPGDSPNLQGHDRIEYTSWCGTYDHSGVV